MVRSFAVGTLIAALALANGASGGDAKLKIGDRAPEFKELPGIDSKNYSLSDFRQDLLVLCITCNHCPIASGYEERIIEFTKKYATGKDARVAFLAINVSTME